MELEPEIDTNKYVWERLNNDLMYLHYRITLDNNYIVSLIRGEYSYGGKEGCYEAMIIHGEVNEGTFQNPTGWIHPIELNKFLDNINAWPPTKPITYTEAPKPKPVNRYC